MSKKYVSLPKLHSGQAKIKSLFHKHRFVVVNCARRYGKSILGIDIVITRALETGKDTAYISISYKQLLSLFENACSILAPIATFDRQNKVIKLPNGARIVFWSIDNNIADKIRGQKYTFIVIDEAAYIPGLISIFDKVLRPTLIDYRGQCLFISTPNGYNDFYKLYQENRRNPYQWASYQASSFENPYLPREELEALKNSLPDRVYRSEILAEFLESNAGVFTNISALVNVPPKEYTGIVSIGVDLARSGDNTAILVMQGHWVVVLFVYKDMPYTQQIDMLHSIAKKYKPEIITIENNGLSQPIVEQLSLSGLPIAPFHTTNASKKVIIENLAVAIEQKDIYVSNEIAHVQQLLDELAAYESKQNTLGTITYNASSGHDDTVIAFALAYSAIRESNSPLVLW
jgi:hypothetical protein